MNKLLSILLISLCLNACSSQQIKHEVKEVYIPVEKKCSDKELPKKPNLCVDSLDNTEKLDVIVKCLTQDIESLEIYSSELEVLICK